MIENDVEPCLYVKLQRDGVDLEIDQGNDEWMPMKCTKKANKWDAAGQNVTAIVGAGVLALPAVFKILKL